MHAGDFIECGPYVLMFSEVARYAYYEDTRRNYRIISFVISQIYQYWPRLTSLSPDVDFLNKEFSFCEEPHRLNFR